jgi:hypothetical protein
MYMFFGPSTSPPHFLLFYDFVEGRENMRDNKKIIVFLLL